MDSKSQAALIAGRHPPCEITIHKLDVAYTPGEYVLRGLDLEIASGEVLALVGPSGCGKSTLLRAIAGLIRPLAGEIQLGQGQVSDETMGSVLSYVFQDPTLLPWRTVIENVRLPLEIQGGELRGTRLVAAVERAMLAVGLDQSSWSKYPRQLSGGMRMRTSIARALVTDPDVLLLDEPFAALDDLLRTKLNELVLQLWHERPRTIVFVTHNIAEAVYMSHRVAVVANHRIARLIENQVVWPRVAEQRVSLDFAQQYGVISKALAEVAET